MEGIGHADRFVFREPFQKQFHCTRQKIFLQGMKLILCAEEHAVRRSLQNGDGDACHILCKSTTFI